MASSSSITHSFRVLKRDNGRTKPWPFLHTLAILPPSASSPSSSLPLFFSSSSSSSSSWQQGGGNRGRRELRRGRYGERILHLPQKSGVGRMSLLLSPQNGEALFCVLASCAALGQVLEKRTKWGANISSPLLAMGVGMVLSGAQVIPRSSPVYDFVLSSIMPIAVALSLLETNVQRAFSDAGSVLKAFWYGALGTLLGTIVSFKFIGHAMGVDGWKIASALCASYIGGSINYAATAQALGLKSSGILAAGMAADNLAMAAYFAIIMSIPESEKDIQRLKDDGNSIDDVSKPTVETIAVSLASAAAACTVGNAFAGLLPSSFAGCGLAVIALVASLFSAVMAHVEGVSAHATVRSFAGSETLGASLMLLFFSVIGASAGFQEAFSGGWPLLIFITLLILVHLGVILSLGAWSKLPMRSVLIASNANIGGPATAAAMANCRCWREMVRPALLVGTLGYTIGTTIGCLVGVNFLQPMLFK